MAFDKILGQHRALETLRGFLKTKKIPRAMVFCGPQGVGKAAAAREFAKALNCLDENAVKKQESCGFCRNCLHIEAGTHPDVIFADYAYQAALRKEEPEKQQTIKVDTVRALTAASQQKAAAARWKVFIIDSAQTLLEEGANALLKFIEEPPDNTVWILISSKREAMLPTILSRCQSVTFAPLGNKIIEDILIREGVESSLAAQAARFAQGSGARARLSAQALEDIIPLESGPAFAAQAAQALPRVLASARVEAGCLLDMLSCAAYEKWILAREEKQKSGLKELLEKIVFYKKALGRNTSPALVTEAALNNAEKFGIDLKQKNV